jgi:hypothetical protein
MKAPICCDDLSRDMTTVMPRGVTVTWSTLGVIPWLYTHATFSVSQHYILRALLSALSFLKSQHLVSKSKHRTMSTSVAPYSVPVSASATAADTVTTDAEISSFQPPLSWCQAALSEPPSASPLTVHAVPETPSGLDLVASHAFSVAALHSVTEQLNVAEQLLASERLINRANIRLGPGGLGCAFATNNHRNSFKY